MVCRRKPWRGWAELQGQCQQLQSDETGSRFLEGALCINLTFALLDLCLFSFAVWEISLTTFHSFFKLIFYFGSHIFNYQRFFFIINFKNLSHNMTFLISEHIILMSLSEDINQRSCGGLFFGVLKNFLQFPKLSVSFRVNLFVLVFFCDVLRFP